MNEEIRADTEKMAKPTCDECLTVGMCGDAEFHFRRRGYVCNNFRKPIKQTNADRMRAMSDAELAEANVRRAVIPTEDGTQKVTYITTQLGQFDNMLDAIVDELVYLKKEVSQ